MAEISEERFKGLCEKICGGVRGQVGEFNSAYKLRNGQIDSELEKGSNLAHLAFVDECKQFLESFEGDIEHLFVYLFDHVVVESEGYGFEEYAHYYVDGKRVDSTFEGILEKMMRAVGGENIEGESFLKRVMRECGVCDVVSFVTFFCKNFGVFFPVELEKLKCKVQELSGEIYRLERKLNGVVFRLGLFPRKRSITFDELCSKREELERVCNQCKVIDDAVCGVKNIGELGFDYKDIYKEQRNFYRESESDAGEKKKANYKQLVADGKECFGDVEADIDRGITAISKKFLRAKLSVGASDKKKIEGYVKSKNLLDRYQKKFNKFATCDFIAIKSIDEFAVCELLFGN